MTRERGEIENQNLLLQKNGNVITNGDGELGSWLAGDAEVYIGITADGVTQSFVMLCVMMGPYHPSNEVGLGNSRPLWFS